VIRVVNKKKSRPEWAKGKRVVYGGRPGKGVKGPLGNPFPKEGNTVQARHESVDRFREWFFGESREARVVREKAVELLGEDDVLECWCVPEECHCCVIADFVNGVRRWKKDREEQEE
jgi:hypothetical protein